MKCNAVQLITRCVVTVLLIASAPSVAVASSLYWDATPGAPNGASDGGSGTWDLSTANWDNTTAYQAWINSNNDTAVFGGTAGAVTQGVHVTVGGLDFGVTGYTIAPGVGPYSITNGTPVTINVAAGTATISSEIAGANSITKTGTGILVLRGLNSWTGDTIISSGTIQLGFNNDTGTLGPLNYPGDITIATGALLDMVNNNSQTFSGVISGGGNLQKRGGGTLTLTGENTYTGKTIIGGGGAGGRTVEIYSINSVNGGVPSMASSSLGAPTTIENGTIQLGDGGSVRRSDLIYLGPGEITDRIMNVRFNSSSQHSIFANNSTTNLLKFTGALDYLPSSGTTGSGLTLRGTGNAEFAGGSTNSANSLVYPGFLDKDDAGTWTLSGGSYNVYSSTVKNGKLIVNGTLTAASSVTVNSAGTLGGTGVIGGTNFVNGTLSPGDSLGTLTFEDDLTLNNLSTYAFDGEDLTVVSGTLTLNDNWTLVLGEEIKSGGSVVIFSYGTLTGGADLEPTIDVSGLGFTPGTLSLTDTGSEIVLNGVQAASTPPAGTVLVIR